MKRPVAIIKNYLHYASTLDAKKVINALLIFFSYQLSKITKKPYIAGFPISISIEPTTSCNLRCPECPSGKREFSRPTGMISLSLFEKIINELQSHLSYLTFYFQGEPYLHTDFLSMVKYAVSKKIYTATSTNAHYLNDDVARKTVESGLHRMIISIDGTTQESYESYRVGGDLKKVIQSTKNIIKWKKQLKSSTPYVVFQFLVVKHNQHQLNEIRQLSKELEVDELCFKTAQVYDHKNGHRLIPTIEKYSRYSQKKDGSFEIKNKLLNQCWRMWHSCVITWDGKIVPCCFDKDASHILGDIGSSSFSSVWKGEQYVNFRSALLRSREEIDICSNCSEGTKVWA